MIKGSELCFGRFPCVLFAVRFFFQLCLAAVEDQEDDFFRRKQLHKFYSPDLQILHSPFDERPRVPLVFKTLLERLIYLGNICK